jgi:outer membrane protein assembly factor BamB
MARTTLAGAAVVALAGAVLGAPEAAPMPRAVPVDEDITAAAKEWNTAKYAAPPTEFRAGHVTPRKLDAKAVQKTALGFTVQLPSKAPVPTPTVYDGRVYVSGGFHSKEFYCFNAATGELAWAADLDDDGPSAAVCDDGVCVFNTESCTVFAVDSATGKHLWSHWLGDPLTSTPTIAEGVVFTSYPAAGGGGKGGKADPGKAPPCSHVLCALELKTGKILWQRWLDSDVMSAPVASGDEVYCTSFGGVVYRFARKDGAVRSAVKTRATSAPVVVGGEVYFSRRADKGGAAMECAVAWNAADGRQRAAGAAREAAYLDAEVQAAAGLKGLAMKLDAGNGFAGGAPGAANPDAAKGNVGQDNVATMQAFQGSRVLHLDGKNFNTMGDRVVCNDAKTGEELWTHKLDGDLKKDGGFLGAPPAAAGGHLILTTLKGDVLRMDEAGKVVKTWETKSPTRFQPAVVGGRIYVGTQDGKLICIDTGDKALTGWSCWGGNPQHTGVGAAK